MKNNFMLITEFLPTYIVQDFSSLSIINILGVGKQINANNIENFEIDFMPQWVKDDIKIGNKGEMIAQLYLETLFPQKTKRASIASSSYGYDIEANNQYYEIKTSQNNSLCFYMSINELETAYKLNNQYNLFYIQLQKNKANGFIINDFFNSFKLNLKDLTQKFKNKYIKLDAKEFCFTINTEFLNTLKPINLNRELKIVNDYINIKSKADK